MKTLGKVMGYKIHRQKIISLPTYKWQINQRWNQENKPIHSSLRITSYNKKLKYLYNKDFKVLKKNKLKKTSEDGKTIHAHGLGRLILWKMTILSKAIYGCNGIPIKFKQNYSQKL